MLQGDRPSEILERIWGERDQLELWQRTLAAVHDRAWLLDPEALALRWAARIAMRAPGWDGSGGLEAFLAERLEEAAQDLIEEDLTAELEGRPVEEPLEWRFQLVAALGVEPGLTRLSCARFHELEERARRAFLLCGVERLPTKQAARELGCSEEEVEQDLMRALIALTRPTGEGNGFHLAEDGGGER